MRDDFLTADWGRHHGDFTTGIRTLLRTLDRSLRRLNALQFEAPWRHDANRRAHPRD